MRHRRPAQRRQVDAVQRAHQGGHRGGELSVLHHRAERRHRRGARPAARRARGDREAAEGDRRRRSSSSTSPGWSRAPRRARGSATSSSPTSARPTRSRTSCAASRTTTSCTSPGKIDPVVGHRDDQHRARARRSRDGRAAARALREGRALRRRQGSAAPRRGAREVPAGAGRGEAGAHASISTTEELAVLQPLFLLTMKPTIYVANVARARLRRTTRCSSGRGARGDAEGAPVVAICAALEAEIADMSDEDKQVFLADMGLDGARPRPRHPRRLHAARPADLLHRRPEGGARVDRPASAPRRRRRPASSTPTSSAASSAPR